MATLENLTVMFTDIVGFSDLVAKLSRLESEKLLEKHDQILSKVIKRFGGRKIKSVGDSFMVVFRSPTDAVLCAMAMHDALWDDSQESGNVNPIIIRVALNAGEVRLTNNDVFGDAVNIASRLEEVTPPNSVYLTEAVYLSMNKSEVALEQVDSFKFKGVREKITVYKANYKPLINRTKNHLLTDDVNYPYGGAHIHHKASNKPLLTVGKFTLALCTLLIVVFMTWWATITYMPGFEREKIVVEYGRPEQQLPVNQNIDVLSEKFLVTKQIKEKALPLLEKKNYLGLENLVLEYSEEYKDNAYLRMLAGHADMYFKRYKSAIDNYTNAFSNDPVLSNDPLSAKNLIKLLDYERKKANKLIARYINKTLINYLSLRTGEKGLTARYDAFYLLKDSGNTKLIDSVGLNIWDLRELEQCQLKKIAVTELNRLQDARALVALKEVVEVSFIDRFKYSCLRRDAKKAIAAIEGKQASDAGNL